MLKVIFSLCVLLLSLGQLVSLSTSEGSGLYVFDAFILVFSLVGLYYSLNVKKSIKIPRYATPFIYFALVCFASLIFVIQQYAISELLTAFFYLVRFVCYLLAACLVYNLIKQEYVDKVFLVSGLLVSILGFIQLVILPDFEVLSPTLGWDPHKNRLAGAFFDPNFTGAYLVLIITVFMDRHFFKQKKLTLLEISAFFILLTALLLTFSRSAWLMFAFVILIYGMFKSRTLLLVAFIIAFSAYFAVPRIQTRISGVTDPADSASLRFISWGRTLEIAQDHLLTGTGFNAFRYVQRDYGFLDEDTFNIHSGAGSDSSLLFVLATTGIVGLCLFLFGFAFPVLDNVWTKGCASVFSGALVLSLLLNSQFINSLFYPQIMFFWMIYMFSCSSSSTSHQ